MSNGRKYRRKSGAGNETRTRDPDLGKVVLYQLSYSRIRRYNCTTFILWSGKRDSNSRPRPWQGRALPTELFPHRRILLQLLFLIWSGKRDSNSRPRPWQGRALPTELFPRRQRHKFFIVTGCELYENNSATQAPLPIFLQLFV